MGCGVVAGLINRFQWAVGCTVSIHILGNFLQAENIGIHLFDQQHQGILTGLNGVIGDRLIGLFPAADI